jgi:hypothetical protein
MLEGLRGALDVRGRWIQVECSLVLGAVGASSELAARGDVVSDETMDLCHLVRPKASGECFMELIMEATCPCRVWCFRSVAWRQASSGRAPTIVGFPFVGFPRGFAFPSCVHVKLPTRVRRRDR